MKRTDRFIKLTTVVLFIAVVVYIGISLYNAFMSTFETTPAISYSVEETFPADGFIVRTERVLSEFTGSAVLPVVREGERVANGQPVAVEYMTAQALNVASEIRSLRLRISQLETAGSSRTIEASRLESVKELSKAMQDSDFSRLDEMQLNIETLIFESDALSAEGLEAMRTRLSALEGASAGVRTFLAPESGTFSQVVDGFEHVAPGDLSDILPHELEELFERPSRTTGVGKLVTNFRWNFASIMSAEDASGIREGSTVSMQFTGAFHTAKNMRVESIGRADADGRRVVIFSSDRSIHEIAQLRQLSAEIVYDTITGLRVPKEAIHLDDSGTLHVFIQTGIRAERVNVEILREYGDVYLVRDGLETGSPLRPGSTIIVRANNLYHGKVVG